MRRRSVLRALAGTAGVSGVAGCNALFPPESTATTTERTRDADSSTGTSVSGSAAGPMEGSQGESTESAEAYRAAGTPTLDRPRGVRVRNLGSGERFVTVVVTAPEGSREEILAESVPVPATETVSFPAVLRSEGDYGVLVETADGERSRYEWAVVDTLDDLWVDLTPTISFRRPVFCPADSPFVVGEPPTVAYDVPASVGVGDALGRSPALALDTGVGAPETRARLKIWHQGRLHLDVRYDLPPDVRALVPVFPAGRRYDVLLRTGDGEAIYDWQPSVRHTLYASLDGGPTFRCGDASHDLRVRNETDTSRRIRVRVSTGDRTLFERSFGVDANEVATTTAAVEPAGPLQFEITTGDGRRETYNWVRCAPNGPIVVALGDDGVSVSVRPTV